MSAFIVSDNHITALVNAAYHYARKNGNIFSYHFGNRRYSLDRLAFDSEQESERMAADELKRVLLTANIRAVNIRYKRSDPLPETCSFRRHNILVPQAVEILKALDCYEYQCCEDPDYASTEAAAFIAVLRKHAICALDGYNEAAWSIA
jgi:hypothetical protein